MKQSQIRFPGLIALFMLVLLTPGTAWCISTVNSSSFGASVNLVFLATGSGLAVPITFSSGPSPIAAGTAPPAYNVTNSLPNFSAGMGLESGSLSVNAASTFPSLLNVTANATVNNAAVSIDPLISITAGQVQSAARIDPSLTGIGTTTIVNGAAGSAGPLPSSPAPNTIFLNTNGLKVVLNEQTIGGDGLTSRDLTVNAIDITFTNVPFSANNSTGVLNGQIILSHSEAHAQGVSATVPEPSSVLLFASALAAMGCWRALRSVTRRALSGLLAGESYFLASGTGVYKNRSTFSPRQ